MIRSPVSLMTPEARGGGIAEGGFRSQDHLILARVPGWLAEDGFTALIREAHGDAEASFHVPGAGLVREFVEYKDHEIQPADFRAEIARFSAMHSGAPGAHRRFVLSTRGLSPTLRPVHAALDRVRGALPFYADVPAITLASYNDYEAAAAKLEISAPTARFVYEHVVLEPDAPDAERYGPTIFGEAAIRHLAPALDARSSELERARRSLGELLVSRKAEPVQRAEIVQALGAGFAGMSELEREAPLRVHTHGSPNDSAPNGAVPFRWEQFFGGATRTYPTHTEWDNQVVGELRDFRRWAIETGRSRRIALTGSRRLSASVAIGSVLSAVAGFRIEMVHRGEIWKTEAHGDGSTPGYAWREHFYSGTDPKSADIAVGIGVINDVEPEVGPWLDKAGMGAVPRLFLHSTAPITSDAHENQAVRAAKQVIQAALGKSRATTIHLFLATPAHFALFLGHRFNSTASVICYERTQFGYGRTCTVWDCP